jgi:hypothetical protein
MDRGGNLERGINNPHTGNLEDDELTAKLKRRLKEAEEAEKAFLPKVRAELVSPLRDRINEIDQQFGERKKKYVSQAEFRKQQLAAKADRERSEREARKSPKINPQVRKSNQGYEL